MVGVLQNSQRFVEELIRWCKSSNSLSGEGLPITINPKNINTRSATMVSSCHL